jgi:hypothetical protein
VGVFFELRAEQDKYERRVSKARRPRTKELGLYRT